MWMSVWKCMCQKKAMALSEAWASEGPYYEIRHLLGGSDGPLACKHGVLWLSGEVFHGVYILYGNSHALLYGILTVCRIFCFLLCFVVYIVLVSFVWSLYVWQVMVIFCSCGYWWPFLLRRRLWGAVTKVSAGTRFYSNSGFHGICHPLVHSCCVSISSLSIILHVMELFLSSHMGLSMDFMELH